MKRSAAGTLAAVVALAALLAACGGGGTKTNTTASAGTPRPEAGQAVISGDPAVDKLIAAALAGDDIGLAGLAGYTAVACKKDSAQHPGDPPACRASEADAAKVEVLPASGCDTGWVRPEEVPDAFRANLAGKLVLLAVLKPNVTPDTFGGGFGADTVIVFQTGAHSDGQAAGVALHARIGRVAWIEHDCHNVLELIAPVRVASFVVDPKGSVTPATPSP
jgi:hypothetical protein